TGWEGDPDLWKVENGDIVGRSATGLKHNEFLKSQMTLEDFRLVLKIKLVPNKENSGIQFRSEKFGEYEMKAPRRTPGPGGGENSTKKTDALSFGINPVILAS